MIMDLNHIFLGTGGPINYNGLILITIWVNNYTHYNVWYEITYSFPSFNGAAVEVWK